MRSLIVLAACSLALAWGSATLAQVVVSDQGVQTSLIGPGAPAHTIGLMRHSQVIGLDTGRRHYAVRYVVARDEKRPGVAIPGEGYIGMTQPEDCNWYGAGFFDLQLEGESIGSTPIHSLTGRGAGNRGTVDFVFDTPRALVRIRFVALAEGDCLYAQVLLEPKQALQSVRVSTRCYPSAFVSDAQRHVLTPARDLAQGQRAEMDPATEWWALYHDRLYDAGYAGPQYKGAGPCAMMWLPEQTDKVSFTVGSYGTDTALDLKPDRRDFRFIFWDYSGTRNQTALQDLMARGVPLRQELAGFSFTDPVLANWPLEQKQAEVQRALAALPQDKEAVAQYEAWARELTAQLALVRSGPTGAIMAEAKAAQMVADWERGLPALKLKALLNRL